MAYGVLYDGERRTAFTLAADVLQGTSYNRRLVFCRFNDACGQRDFDDGVGS